MSNSNFNICPKCGTANSLVAKYCFQCGSQLKTTEQPVVCGKCNTVNPSNATYCKSCGTQLLNGGHSKICPRCNNIIAGGATICSKCGYSFAVTTQVDPIDNPTGLPVKPPKKVKPIPVGATKARVGAIISIALILIFAYLIIMPSFMSVPLLDRGYVRIADYGKTIDDSGSNIATGYLLINEFVMALLSNDFVGHIGRFSVNEWIIYIILAVTLITMFVQLISNIIRLFTGKLPKNKNKFAVFMLIVGIITLIYLVLNQYSAIIANSSTGVFVKLFGSWALTSTTWLLLGYYLNIGYYLVMLIVSCIFRKPKQQVIRIGRQ